jgi:hypothetical protein
LQSDTFDIDLDQMLRTLNSKHRLQFTQGSGGIRKVD